MLDPTAADEGVLSGALCFFSRRNTMLLTDTTGEKSRNGKSLTENKANIWTVDFYWTNSWLPAYCSFDGLNKIVTTNIFVLRRLKTNWISTNIIHIKFIEVEKVKKKTYRVERHQNSRNWNILKLDIHSMASILYFPKQAPGSYITTIYWWPGDHFLLEGSEESHRNKSPG